MTYPHIWNNELVGGHTYHALTLGGVLLYTEAGTFDKNDFPGLRAIRYLGEIILADDLDDPHTIALDTEVSMVPEIGTYVPELTSTGTNPTLGTGAAQDGWYVRMGNFVVGWAFISMGTGFSPGSGAYKVSFPFTPNADLATYMPVGMTYLYDANSAANRQLGTMKADGSFLGLGTISVGPTAPFTWQDNDQIRASFAYYMAADPTIEIPTEVELWY